jgi:hypothetical protein
MGVGVSSPLQYRAIPAIRRQFQLPIQFEQWDPLDTIGSLQLAISLTIAGKLGPAIRATTIVIGVSCFRARQALYAWRGPHRFLIWQAQCQASGTTGNVRRRLWQIGKLIKMSRL